MQENSPTDTELIHAAQAGDTEAERTLMIKYKDAATSLCKGYFLPGGDTDDIQQEALIGLFEAIHSYSDSYTIQFWTFARICIMREIITAVKSANRYKRSILNHYISIDKTLSEDAKYTLSNIIPDPNGDPEEEYILQEERILRWKLAEEVLTPYMLSILKMFVLGYGYSEIAASMGCTTKNITNIMYIIRQKLAKASAEANKLMES